MDPIGTAAQKSELPVKTIRYYDEIGLIKPQAHSEKGYRLYSERDIQKLIFVRHVREFGFSIDTCRDLLDLYENPHRTSKEVKQIVAKKLVEIQAKIRAMKQLHDTLARLAHDCHGDQRPDCPIIEYFSSDQAVDPSHQKECS
ncbi:MAG: MerR family transcriptional regulator [Acidobacteria bacterium]|nr:MerR family transcriptional regulator [Acidobacteriota bacterium]MCB9399529.1 MerR family transcriptional regulator [Acidobacteriota bacterium]